MIRDDPNVPPVCGPFHEEIPRSRGAGSVAPALTVYRSQLHLVTQLDLNCEARKSRWVPLRVVGKGLCNDYEFPLQHRIFENARWSGPERIPDQLSKKGVGLAAYGNHLHMVHLGNESNDLWHSMFDGRAWSRNVRIPGQKSKKRPALATYGNALHMLHLGDSSDDLWHSRYVPGRGWTRNVRIGQKSRFTPALAEYDGRLHMVRASYKNPRAEKVVHTSFDGREWRKHLIVPVVTNTAPTLAFDPANGRPWLELTTLQNGRITHSLFSRQRGWFRKKSLADLKADSPAAIEFYKGCWHMVSVRNDRLMQTTFGTADIHAGL